MNSLSGLSVCLPEDKRETLSPMECQSFRPTVTFPKLLVRVSSITACNLEFQSWRKGHRSNIEKCTSSKVEIEGKVDTDLILTNSTRFLSKLSAWVLFS